MTRPELFNSDLCRILTSYVYTLQIWVTFLSIGNKRPRGAGVRLAAETVPRYPHCSGGPEGPSTVGLPQGGR